MTIVWRGDKEIVTKMGNYGRDVKRLAEDTLREFAPQIEADAKENAPWKDITGETREALFTIVESIGLEMVALFLSHGKTKKHGKQLELRWAGKFSIILPTLERYYSPIITTLQDRLR